MYLFSTVTYSRHLESLTSETNTTTHFRAKKLLEYENDKSRYFLGAQAEFRSSVATEASLKI